VLGAITVVERKPLRHELRLQKPSSRCLQSAEWRVKT
jgi:hypothetical protein